jgi:excisionase family DNA binding protein
MTAQDDKQPYLTVKDVAGELGTSTRNVYKLIGSKKLSALKRSERGTRIPRWALEAYQRKINGLPSLVAEPVHMDVGQLAEQFQDRSGGLSPRDWYAAFKAGQIEDTSENMTLLVQAVALGAGRDDDQVPAAQPAEHGWALAAFTTHPPR